jgi:Mce-associated membrane protein
LPWALVIVLAGAGVTFALLWQGQREMEARRVEVEDVTRLFLTALTSFTAERIERDVEEIRSFAVGEFSDEVDQTFGPERIAAIQQSRANSVGRVREVYVESLEGSSAQVFAVVQETVVSSTQTTPQTDVLRVLVGLIETPDGWKVDSVEILPSPGTG